MASALNPSLRTKLATLRSGSGDNFFCELDIVFPVLYSVISGRVRFSVSGCSSFFWKGANELRYLYASTSSVVVPEARL
ncbi:Uncharacterised protein [Mycobacteroides abscessus subsp. abscessus]|nr:Uncharacterised protein [Mycobacteroides abscessus subsp. abscessus]